MKISSALHRWCRCLQRCIWTTLHTRSRVIWRGFNLCNALVCPFWESHETLSAPKRIYKPIENSLIRQLRKKMDRQIDHDLEITCTMVIYRRILGSSWHLVWIDFYMLWFVALHNEPNMRPNKTGSPVNLSHESSTTAAANHISATCTCKQAPAPLSISSLLEGQRPK